MAGGIETGADLRAPWSTAQVLFIHVPKTAGTTFTAVLDDPEFGQDMRNPRVALLGHDSDLEEMRRRLAQDAPPLYPWEDRPALVRPR